MRLQEIINLARGFRFFRVFVAVIQTELRGSEDWSSGNFILLKASLFNKGLPFRARPSQSGLPSVSPAKARAVKSSVMRIIVLPVGRCRFLEENENGLRFRTHKIWRFTECTTPYNRPSFK